MKSPSTRVHGKILSDIGLADDSSISIIRRFIDSFMSSFESRPGLAGSFLSVFVIAVISSIVIYNSVNLENNNQRNITDDPIEKDEDLDDSLTT